MSEGPRVPLEQAMERFRDLVAAWGLIPERDILVGSARRLKADVGDLEILSPHEPKSADTLHRRIARTVEARTDEGGLFAAGGEGHARVIGREVRGLKPGFLEASLVMTPRPGASINVQVYRYTPANLGWQLILRTGPQTFGQIFLVAWKRAHGIPVGAGVATRPASIDGHLVNAAGEIVPVATEAEAFAAAGMDYVPPDRREAVAAHFEQARRFRAAGTPGPDGAAG